MTTASPTTWTTIDTREVQLNQYSTAFLKMWISMMFYKSSKWLSKVYWDFVSENWEFSKEKYEQILDWIIESIRDRDINIPIEPDVKWILETDIEDFTDTTNVSQSISDFYRASFINNADTLTKIKQWIRSYYEGKLHELKNKASSLDTTVDTTRKLIDEILEWLKLA